MKTSLLRAFSKCGRADQTATHQTSNEGVFHSSAFVSIRVHSWFLTASLRLRNNRSMREGISAQRRVGGGGLQDIVGRVPSRGVIFDVVFSPIFDKEFR